MATKFKVGGRELALVFSMGAMCAMEDAFGDRANLSQESMDSILKSRKDTLTLLAILANAGQALADKPEDVTAKWLGTHLRPIQLLEVHSAILDAISEGMRMEADQPDPDEEVDVVLEDIKKNERPAG